MDIWTKVSTLQSCVPRIVLARRTNLYVVVGSPILERDLTDTMGKHRLVSKRPYALQSDMRRLRAKRAWTTPVDLKFWREGFEAGEEYVLHTRGIPHICTRDKNKFDVSCSACYSYPPELDDSWNSI